MLFEDWKTAAEALDRCGGHGTRHDARHGFVLMKAMLSLKEAETQDSIDFLFDQCYINIDVYRIISCIISCNN